MTHWPLRGLYDLAAAPQASHLCPFLFLTGSWHPSQTPWVVLREVILGKAVLPVCGEALPGWGGYKDQRKGRPNTACKAKPATISPGQAGKGSGPSPAGTPWPTDYLIPHICWAPA